MRILWIYLKIERSGLTLSQILPWMKLSDVKVVQKNINKEKKITVMIWVIMQDVRIVLL